jgi:hypothetical protein
VPLGQAMPLVQIAPRCMTPVVRYSLNDPPPSVEYAE